MNLSIEELLKLLDKNQEFELNIKTDILGNQVTDIPLLGVVKAGYDYLARENWISTVEVDKKLADGNELFALKIKRRFNVSCLCRG